MMKKQWLFALIAFGIIALLGIIFPIDFNTGDTSGIDTGDTAWMLASTALVFLMTPGLGFFYGGMVKPKNVISTILQSFIAMGLISILWVVFGFSLAFGESVGAEGFGLFGNPATFFMFKGVGGAPDPQFAADHSPGTVCPFPVEICHHYPCPVHRFICRKGEIYLPDDLYGLFL